MAMPHLNWRVLVREDAPGASRRALGAQRSSVVVVLGLCSGVLTTFVGGALSPRTAPLALLIVLISTLFAGRFAPIGPALAHGACAWIVLAVPVGLAHGLTSASRGIPGPWSMLLLVEDMALIGRVGYVRRLMARARDTREP